MNRVESFCDVDPELRERWFDVLYRVSHDPRLFGGCAHLLYVGEKRT